MYRALNQLEKAIAEYSIPVQEYRFAMGYDPVDLTYYRIAGKCKSMIMQLQNELKNNP